MSALGLFAFHVCDAVEMTLDHLPFILKRLLGLFLCLVIGSTVCLFLDFLKKFLSVLSRRIHHFIYIEFLSLFKQGDAVTFLWFLAVEVLLDSEALVVV